MQPRLVHCADRRRRSAAGGFSCSCRRSTSAGSASPTPRYGKPASFVGLANYARLLGDPAFWSAFWNTFVVVNVIVYVELRWGSASRCCSPPACRGRRLMIAIVIAPYAISEVVTVVMWKYMFEPDAGIVNYGARSRRAAGARLGDQPLARASR